MKNLYAACVLVVMTIALSQFAAAEAQSYRAHLTTCADLAEMADVIVVGTIDRIENVTLREAGVDAARHKRINDGSIQDGEENIRRDAVITVDRVLKGVVQDEERFVSIRQLKKSAYDEDLQTGEAIYFLYTREDGLKALISDERGTISPNEVGGQLTDAIDFVSTFISSGYDRQAIAGNLLDQIKLNGNRLSIDACIELSWAHDSYSLNEIQKQRLSALLMGSKSGSRERNELLTAVGRHAPEGALNTLLTVMFADNVWSTTSLGAMSLEYVDRGAAIVELLARFENAGSDQERMVAIRALGLIRPKNGHDGVELRTRTLNAIKSLLNAETNKDLLREALIASRDMRSQDAHVAELKALIAGRKTNGLNSPEVHAAIIALAAARLPIEGDRSGLQRGVIAKEFLDEVGVAEPILKQIVDSALKSPYSTMIIGANGGSH
ncbi:MAG: hypothetical protein V3V10_04630 [Planctomycetota bacterium]